jgi:solute carrier family 66 (lysosomal lysine-arginine transporter), member 1
LADLVLLGQIFWYKGFTLRDDVLSKPIEVDNGSTQNERTSLLGPPNTNAHSSNGHDTDNEVPQHLGFDRDRRESRVSFRERYLSIDATHLSKATPLLPEPEATREIVPRAASQSTLETVIYDLIIVVLVFAAGTLGWWLGNRNSHPKQGGGNDAPEAHNGHEFNILGQIFGYISAVLCLGSRIPQLLLNWRRKSTEGISFLFFLFACLGNLTYVLSIVAYSPDLACQVPQQCQPGEAGNVYAKHILINLSWIFQSAGTLLLDLGVFVQFFLYRKRGDESVEQEDYDEAIEDAVGTPVRSARPRRRSVTFAEGS